MTLEKEFASMLDMNIPLQCKGHKAYFEGDNCKLCEKNHMMTFELTRIVLKKHYFSKVQVKEVLDRAPLGISAYLLVQWLREELGSE